MINSGRDEFLNPRVVITSYDLMSKITKQLKAVKFNLVIAVSKKLFILIRVDHKCDVRRYIESPD